MATYIGGRKGAVLQWVDLRPIFEVYVWEKRFKGGGRLKASPIKINLVTGVASQRFDFGEEDINIKL